MKSKTKRLNLRISDDDLDALKEACLVLDITVADFLRETAIKKAYMVRAGRAGDLSVLSASVESEVDYFTNAIRLRQSVKEQDSGADSEQG